MIGRLAVVGCLLASAAQAQSGDAGYRVGVVSESGDIVTWLKPSGTGLTVDRVLPVAIQRSLVFEPHDEGDIE